MPDDRSLDAHPPAEIAALVENAGVAKCRMPTLKTLTLGFLAGVFIALGAMMFTLVMTGLAPDASYGVSRVIGGLVFSLGLVLVVVGGAELFTGNNLIVMALAEGKVTAGEVARNWFLVLIGNTAGALAMAVLAVLAGFYGMNDGGTGEVAIAIARGKLALDPVTALVRGLLCNILVCLAVWLCFAARSVTGKILAIIFPITAFVALGFEHSIANLFLIPVPAIAGLMPFDLAGFLGNLIPVTIGNIIGGGVCVGGVYWLVYLRTPAG